MENGNVVDRSEDRGGIFAGDDPFLITKSWLEEARKSEPNDPEAMALATVDAEGMPDCRMVLLKGIEPSAFLFYTNYGSAKSQQLEATGVAALLFHWKSMRRQIRIRGEVTREDGAIADEYFASRHPESRVGAWASRQSAPIMSRQELLDRADTAKAQQGAEPSRPPFWGGWRLRPTQFEFWADGEFRLHNRFRWSETEKNLWQVVRLSP